MKNYYFCSLLVAPSIACSIVGIDQHKCEPLVFAPQLRYVDYVKPTYRRPIELLLCASVGKRRFPSPDQRIVIVDEFNDQSNLSWGTEETPERLQFVQHTDAWEVFGGTNGISRSGFQRAMDSYNAQILGSISGDTSLATAEEMNFDQLCLEASKQISNRKLSSQTNIVQPGPQFDWSKVNVKNIQLEWKDALHDLSRLYCPNSTSPKTATQAASQAVNATAAGTVCVALISSLVGATLVAEPQPKPATKLGPPPYGPTSCTPDYDLQDAGSFDDGAVEDLLETELYQTADDLRDSSYAMFLAY
eukprot:Gregarina_sp_Poly_1__454@NODE_110_length_13975_cov_113_221887_g97_i0_p5_GENE_NODE_110_length_13975_cov_113_221887_g97_i0NODE_110_length_13975_cov_113_221887_g97_i0_p5_ORF_typecomplete_len304_score38_32_NODE_110_length_13975_cov_113_221887_g97_i0931010221